MDLNLEIVLETNIIFVNGIASLVKISKNLEFTMVKYVDNLKKKLAKYLRKVLNLFWKIGLIVATTMMDRIFELLRGGLPFRFNPNTSSAYEHVLKNKQHICFIKEQW